MKFAIWFSCDGVGTVGAEVQAFINEVLVMSRTRTSYVADVFSHGWC